MYLRELQDLGFTEEEAKVYLTILELGGGYVSAVAKKSGVHRVTCYNILDKLLKKGVINQLVRNNMKYYTIESPKILLNQIEDKFKKAQDLIPGLLSLTSDLAYRPKIHYYEGIDGVKSIFNDNLKANTEILGYTNLASLPKVMDKKFMNDYAKTKMKRKIKTRMLSPMTEEAMNFVGEVYPSDFDMDLVEILFINPKEFMFEYEIDIYDDKVVIISLNPDELIGMIIESKVYADTQKAIFNLAWLGATSFVAR